MKRYFSAMLIPTVLGFALILSCSQNTNNKHRTSVSTNLEQDSIKFKKDSIKLKKLVINLLEWHAKDTGDDFDVISSHDSIYVGINWQSHKKRMAQLAKTNFFTKNFLDNYQNIALHLDKELKENKEKWLVGDIPPYSDDANDWCNCQDYPSDNWQNTLKIINLNIKDTIATFKWTWSKDFSYSVKAVKENEIWKIAELERFSIENYSW